MSKLRSALLVKLPDQDAEAARRNLNERVDELQALPFASARVIQGIQLPDSVEVTISHGLGRSPVCVIPSVLVGGVTAGLLTRYQTRYASSGAPIDGSKFVVLAAFGYGATITLDLVVL